MDELKDSPDLPGESPFAPVQTPRLSIMHLMLWTLCSALYLSVYRVLLSHQEQSAPPGYAGIQNASSVINGVVVGAIFAGAVVLVATRVRTGPPMCRQPGHWLLVVAALRSALFLPMMVLMLFAADFGQFLLPWNMLIYAALLGISPLGYGLAAWHERALGWRLLFLLLVAGSAATCVAYTSISISAFNPNFGPMGSWTTTLLSLQGQASLLITGVVVAMSIWELVAGRRRDWLHWAGITTYAAGNLVGLLWMVATWFIR